MNNSILVISPDSVVKLQLFGTERVSPGAKIYISATVHRNSSKTPTHTLDNTLCIISAHVRTLNHHTPLCETTHTCTLPSTLSSPQPFIKIAPKCLHTLLTTHYALFQLSWEHWITTHPHVKPHLTLYTLMQLNHISCFHQTFFSADKQENTVEQMNRVGESYNYELIND